MRLFPFAFAVCLLADLACGGGVESPPVANADSGAPAPAIEQRHDTDGAASSRATQEQGELYDAGSTRIDFDASTTADTGSPEPSFDAAIYYGVCQELASQCAACEAGPCQTLALSSTGACTPETCAATVAAGNGESCNEYLTDSCVPGGW
jgi:hypothetical protein